MFQFIFFVGLKILSNFTNASSSLSCISMKNQECKVRPDIINVNSLRYYVITLLHYYYVNILPFQY